MATVEQTKWVYRYLLGHKAVFVEAAILTLFERQTSAEQASKETTESNGVGFSGVDAEILSSFAVHIKQSHNAPGFRLSTAQRDIAKKRMPKYARQLIEASNPAKVEMLVEKFLPEANKLSEPGPQTGAGKVVTA